MRETFKWDEFWDALEATAFITAVVATGALVMLSFSLPRICYQ